MVIAQIIKMWFDGYTATRIANELNLKLDFVCTFLRQEGYIS